MLIENFQQVFLPLKKIVHPNVMLFIANIHEIFSI